MKYIAYLTTHFLDLMLEFTKAAEDQNKAGDTVMETTCGEDIITGKYES